MSRLSVLIAVCAALVIAGAAGLVAALGSADSIRASSIAGVVWFSVGAVILFSALIFVMRMRIRSRRSAACPNDVNVEAFASVAR